MRARIPGGSATLIVIGALAAAAALSPAAAVAAFPGGNGPIAFVRGDGLWTIRPDGSGLRRLTTAFDRQPSWSADGERLVFTRHRETLDPLLGRDVMTINADGGDPALVVRISGSLVRPAPSFSPSGRRIVYAVVRPPDRRLDLPVRGAIRTVRPDGTERRRLLSGTVKEPQYSPNGRRIVFAGSPEGTGRGGIWSMRRDGTGVRQLTDPNKIDPELTDTAPDYSPDGRHIVFFRFGFRCCEELRVMRANGSRERPIPTRVLELGFPAYAPAGDRIAVPIFSGAPAGFGLRCSDLYTITPTGSDRRNLTNDCDPQGIGGSALSPAWQPDPPSTFTFAGVRKNKRRGTARLRVRVPGPGVLRLEKTRRVKPKRKRAASAGRVTVRVRPRGKARKRIRRCRSAKVRARVTYKPDGAGRNARSKRIKLKRPPRRLRDRTASAAWSRGVRTVCRRLPS